MLTCQCISRLKSIAGVRVIHADRDEPGAPIISFASELISVSDIVHRLDEKHGILCRAGLHCAPAAHRTIGTFPHGTVRFGIGYFNTVEDIDRAADAVEEIVSA